MCLGKPCKIPFPVIRRPIYKETKNRLIAPLIVKNKHSIVHSFCGHVYLNDITLMHNKHSRLAYYIQTYKLRKFEYSKQTKNKILKNRNNIKYIWIDILIHNGNQIECVWNTIVLFKVLRIYERDKSICITCANKLDEIFSFDITTIASYGNTNKELLENRLCIMEL